MITPKQLLVRSPSAIFAAGHTSDYKWVAVRGRKPGPRPDWAIYTGPVGAPSSRIVEDGKKLMDPKAIREIMSCDDDLLDLYRF